MKKALFLIMICFIAKTSTMEGQDKGVPFYSKELILKGESEVRQIELPIIDSLKIITITVVSKIDEGELIIELYNPTGEKNSGYFKLGGKMNLVMKRNDMGNSNKKLSASVSRTIPYPMRGVWKAKVISKGAYGSITVLLIK